jgi:hypothetical protein
LIRSAAGWIKSLLIASSNPAKYWSRGEVFALGLSDDADGASERQRLAASATQRLAG